MRSIPKLFAASPSARRGLMVMLAACVLAGCGDSRTGARSVPPPRAIDATQTALLDMMVSPMVLPDLGMPGGEIVSSTDITGGNNDWSTRMPTGREEWITLADLTGPGFVSRIWMTGWSDAEQPIRLFFDGESEPRLVTTFNKMFGGEFPFQAPFALQENFCAYSSLPIPYAQSLRIEMMAGRVDVKFYFQINFARLSPDSTVESFSPEWTAEQKTAWERTAGLLSANTLAAPDPSGLVTHRQSISIAPDSITALDPVAGPGIIRALRITPRINEETELARWQTMLRQLDIQIRWNGQETPSIELPFGEFFGQNLRLTAYRSLGTSFDGTTFANVLPMPFQQAVISVVNHDKDPKPYLLDVEVVLEPLKSLPTHLGYLHAGWHSSWPEDIGPRHSVLRALGRGKFIGCLLSVDSAGTRSWWGLEGDETIRMDAAFKPQWQGTGVEDYFNGGWYYRRPIAELTTGLLTLIPFHAAQYRWHVLDAPRFHQSIDVQFERGGTNQSPIHMESTAWYYLSAPQQADTAIRPLLNIDVKQPATDEKALAHHLLELERFDDHQGAVRLIRAYQASTTAKVAEPDLLRFRLLMHRERLAGTPAVAAEIAALGTSTSAVVRASVEHRAWMLESPEHALLTVACRPKADVWYNGEKLGTAGPGETTFRVATPTAPAAIALHTSIEEPPAYLHVLLRSRDHSWISDDSWRYFENPPPGWEKSDYDDSSWTKFLVKWLRLIVPPETISPWPEVWSNAENIVRPYQAAPRNMVHRQVLTPENARPTSRPAHVPTAP